MIQPGQTQKDDNLERLKFHSEPPKVLAIFCSDGRFDEQCEIFIETELYCPHFDRFLVPGGAAWIVLDWFTFKEHDVAQESVTFLVQVHKTQRIVLIAHDDCGFYHSKHPYLQADKMREKQKTDIRDAKQVILRWFPGMQVDAYYATVAGDIVAFETID